MKFFVGLQLFSYGRTSCGNFFTANNSYFSCLQCFDSTGQQERRPVCAKPDVLVALAMWWPGVEPSVCIDYKFSSITCHRATQCFV